MKQIPLLVAVFIIVVSLASCGSSGDGSANASPEADEGSTNASPGGSEGSKDEPVASSSKAPSNTPSAKSEVKAQKGLGRAGDSKTPLNASAPEPVKGGAGDTKTPLDTGSGVPFAPVVDEPPATSSSKTPLDAPLPKEPTTASEEQNPGGVGDSKTPLNASAPEPKGGGAGDTKTPLDTGSLKPEPETKTPLNAGAPQPKLPPPETP